MSAQTLPDAATLNRAIEALAEAIQSAHADTPALALVGIANGGIPLAARLHRNLSATRSTPVHLGTVDISFYRDDFGHNPIPKVTAPSRFDFAMDGAVVILCDDVIHSGRTVRAAMNDLFDQGRPGKIELAVLCDRGHRALPIQPDYTGLQLDIPDSGKIRVRLDPDDPSRDALLVETTTAPSSPR